MKLFAVAGACAVAASIGCGSVGGATPPATVRGGSGLVTSYGRIGPLKIDTSSRAQVITFAGRPAAELRRPKSGFTGSYDALGYSCSKRKVDGDVSLPTKAAPNCRTFFFINRETGKLATFITTVSAYHEEHGVRPEMATATAERRLHRRVVEGCATDIYIYRRATRLTIEFAHGRTQASGHVVGGRVSALLLRSRRDDLGLFDC